MGATAQSLWTHGDTVVEDFDPDRGAASYLAKDGLWGILIGCTRHARCRRRHGCSEQSRELAIDLQ